MLAVLAQSIGWALIRVSIHLLEYAAHRGVGKTSLTRIPGNGPGSHRLTFEMELEPTQ